MKKESQPKFAPGPYSVVGHNWSDTSMYGPDDKYMFTLSIDDEDTTEENQGEREQWAEAQMALFAQAPAMYAAMQEFCDRVDRVEVRSRKTYEQFKSILAAARGERV